jgi:hypothetical protein
MEFLSIKPGIGSFRPGTPLLHTMVPLKMQYHLALQISQLLLQLFDPCLSLHVGLPQPVNLAHEL